MKQNSYIVFTAETVFEKAVLHHYRWLFLIVNGNYALLTETWAQHCDSQSELWQAINDPVTHAPNISHKPLPQSNRDLNPGLL